MLTMVRKLAGMTTMKHGFGLLTFSAVSLWAASALAAPFLIVGNDEKLIWDDEGKAVLSARGRDNVVIP